MAQMTKLHSGLWTFLNLIFEDNTEGPENGITLKALQQEFESWLQSWCSRPSHSVNEFN